MSENAFDGLMNDCSKKLDVQFDFEQMSFADVITAIVFMRNLADEPDPVTLLAFLDVISSATDIYLPDLPFGEASAIIEMSVA